MAAKAHPEGSWWTGGLELINKVDKRSDIITLEAREQGFWIIGASNFWLQPDAIVIPDWEVHQQYIKQRFEKNYDGGATPEDHQQVLGHIKVIEKWHTKHNVPKFTSIEEAAMSLTAN